MVSSGERKVQELVSESSQHHRHRFDKSIYIINCSLKATGVNVRRIPGPGVFACGYNSAFGDMQSSQELNVFFFL